MDVREPVLAAVHHLQGLVGRRRVLADELDQTLVTGSWRRLVLQTPSCPSGSLIIERTCLVLEQLHRGLRGREIYAVGADRWGDPRARLLDGE